MDCHQCRDDLTAFLDNELVGLERDQFERHLEKCPPCREEFDDLRDTMDMVTGNASMLSPSPKIWDQLHVRIMEMPAPLTPPGIFRFLVLNRRAAAAATMAATVLVAFGLWAYMGFRRSEDNLRSYMSDYVQMRNTTEHLHSLQLREADASKAMILQTSGSAVIENPFMEMHPVSMSNPFQTEER
jgi:hypothetical protein